MKTFFITGTDTGVGKTIVAGIIAAAMRARRLKVGVMKPAETGCREKRGDLLPSDAIFLKKASGSDLPLDIICPYRFSEALAPAVAAKRAGRKIDLRVIERNFEHIRAESDIVLVEGAGGVMVPFSGRKLYLDLAAELGLPLIIVARAGLGTINHTLLTVAAARARKIKISAIILNQGRKNKGDAASLTNPEAVKDYSGIKAVYSLQFIAGIKKNPALLKKGADILLSQGFLA